LARRCCLGMHRRLTRGGRFRWTRSWPLFAAVIALTRISPAWASPYIPESNTQVLAELPAGVRHASTPARALTASRLDIALPLAQFDISRARATGDLRFLGYAEAILAPWMQQPTVAPQVLILNATILQSRHAFDASLAELDEALKARPQDAQAWLTRATVLRVLGRYGEAALSCKHMAMAADPSVTALCSQSLRGLTGHLQDAYAAIAALASQELSPEVRAWRYSELGEMAERAGNDAAAEHWFREGLQTAPEDFYVRTACADLLLRHDRAAETLQLLAGHESMEPMLLRIAIAHRQLHDGAGLQAEALLSGAFEVEQQRGDAVHRREQARFMLDVKQQPAAALAAAEENWKVQREPDDVLILLRAAQAAHQAPAAAAVLQFLRQTGLEDVRLDPYRGTT
jgi:tetratricopeptide (TPR) repeat protein